MKIAIYYPWIHLKSGVELTILEICKQTQHEYTIFTNFFDLKNTFSEYKDLKVIQLNYIPVKRNIFSVLKAAIIIAFQKIENLDNFDLLFVHTDGLADLILCRNHNIRTLCFCHTPLRPVFDSIYRNIVLKKYKGLSKITFLILSSIFKIIDQKLWKKYDNIIFNSRETQTRALQGKLISPNSDNHKIIYPGVNLDRHIKTKMDKYFLVPGRIKWTKNITLAIKSFILFNKIYNNNKFLLIISGQLDKLNYEYYKKLLKLSKKYSNIKFKISPTNKELTLLYQKCYAVIIPSFNEDWGIVALEANSFKKPVICVNKGGLLESQINNKTALIIKNDVKEFAKAIFYLATNPKLTSILGENAYNNVKKFNQNIFIKKINREITQNKSYNI